MVIKIKAIIKKSQLMFLFLPLFFTSLSANGVEILNAQQTPEYIVKTLQAIAEQAGETSITISSRDRSVNQQVEIMLDYYILCTKGKFANQAKVCGIKLAKQVYHPKCHGGFSAFDPNKSKSDNIRAMSEALTASLMQLGESRVCMNHVTLPGVKTRYIAIDIKPSSVSNLKKFYHAAKNHPEVKRFYYPAITGIEPSPVKESAFHLEFERQE